MGIHTGLTLIELEILEYHAAQNGQRNALCFSSKLLIHLRQIPALAGLAETTMISSAQRLVEAGLLDWQPYGSAVVAFSSRITRQGVEGLTCLESPPEK